MTVSAPSSPPPVCVPSSRLNGVAPVVVPASPAGAAARASALEPVRSFNDDLVDAVVDAAVVIDAADAVELRRVGSAIAECTLALVDNYLSQPVLQRLVPLDAAALEVFSSFAAEPLSLGMIRPDFLYDAAGAHRVCEINARFPLNGSLVGAFADDSVAGTYPGCVPAGTFGPLVDALDELLCSRRVVQVHSAERGNDLLLAAGHRSARLGVPDMWDISTLRVTPLDSAACRYALAAALGDADVAVVELHQHELPLVADVLLGFARSGGVLLNDPRVSLVGHDKRLLSAFSSPELLDELCAGSVPADVVARAASAVIETHPSGAGLAPPVRSAVLAEPSAWFAKRAISGKCDGLVDLVDVTPAELEAVVDGAGVALQRCVDQPLVQVPTPGGVEPERDPGDDWYSIAGTLPCVGTTCFGPGLSRAFHDPPIAGAWLLPTVVAEVSP